MKKVILNTLAVPLASMLLLFARVEASADTYKPAVFGFDGEAIAAKIGEGVSDTPIAVYCQSDVDAAGKSSVSRCYSKQASRDLSRRLETVISSLRFIPAEVNTEAVPVRVSYRVILSASGVELIPNLGTMQAKYGRDYIAPQERLDVFDWYQKYAKDSWVSGEAFLGEGDLSRVAATVNKQGQPEVVRTIEAERAHKRDATIVKNAVRRSRFIPGFVAGEPAPMGYLAVVNYPERSEAIGSR